MPPLAGAFRRLAAAAYDGLLLLAVLMCVTALLAVFTHGEAIIARNVGAWVYPYRALIAITIVLYFGISWTKRGQTLGMKAWSVRLETTGGTTPRWGTVLLRLACAAPLYLALVGGVLLYMAHRGGWPVLLGGAVPLAASHGWHALTGRGTLPDRLSGTRIVASPSRARPA